VDVAGLPKKSFDARDPALFIAQWNVNSSSFANSKMAVLDAFTSKEGFHSVLTIFNRSWPDLLPRFPTIL
jgi:hypothetical protein